MAVNDSLVTSRSWWASLLVIGSSTTVILSQLSDSMLITNPTVSGILALIGGLVTAYIRWDDKRKGIK